MKNKVALILASVGTLLLIVTMIYGQNQAARKKEERLHRLIDKTVKEKIEQLDLKIKETDN